MDNVRIEYFNDYMAQPSKTAKDDRIELRVSPEHKQLIEQAASLSGLSLSSYMLSQAVKSAKKDIEGQEMFSLTDRDRNRFLKALENPPAPNSRLKKAAKKYRFQNA